MRTRTVVTLALRIGLATVGYATSPSPQQHGPDGAPAAANARYAIHGDGESRILLDA